MLSTAKLGGQTQQAWDLICQSSPDAWFLHTRAWIEYQKAYRPSAKSQDYSFLVFDANQEPVAICPLFLESHESRLEFSFGGSHLPTPAVSGQISTRRREEVLKTCMETIDDLGRSLKVSRCSFRLSPLADSESNWLVRFGYLDCSLQSQVLDTSASLDALAADVRKGHWSDITRGNKVLKAEIHDANGVTDELFATYESLHAKAAGRVTRPRSTFEAMKRMIRDGAGILVSAKSESGQDIGFALVLLYKKRAYYASGANDPDPAYSRLPVAHVLQWKAIQWLNANGFDRYEIGWQQFGPQLHDVPSLKEVQISRFKRGFGGRTVPLFIGEKYYDPLFCAEVLEKRKATYLSAAFQQKALESPAEPEPKSYV